MEPFNVPQVLQLPELTLSMDIRSSGL